MLTSLCEKAAHISTLVLLLLSRPQQHLSAGQLTLFTLLLKHTLIQPAFLFKANRQMLSRGKHTNAINIS